MNKKKMTNNEQDEIIPDIPGVNKNKTIITPIQKIQLKDIPSGTIIDIGGGGEGFIAQLGGSRVTAIDRRQKS